MVKSEKITSGDQMAVVEDTMTRKKRNAPHSLRYDKFKRTTEDIMFLKLME